MYKLLTRNCFQDYLNKVLDIALETQYIVHCTLYIIHHSSVHNILVYVHLNVEVTLYTLTCTLSSFTINCTLFIANGEKEAFGSAVPVLLCKLLHTVLESLNASHSSRVLHSSLRSILLHAPHNSRVLMLQTGSECPSSRVTAASKNFRNKKKSCIQKTLNISTNADSSTDTIGEGC